VINLPAIELIEISPTKITPAPLESAIWAEFLTLQISPATRKSYAASLKDFSRRRFDRPVSPEVIEEFLSCSEYDALTHVLAYRGQLLEAGLSSGTVNARLAALKSFVTHAAKRKLCTFRLDDIRSVKAQSYKDTRGISIEQFRLMIDVIDRSTSLGKRNHAIMRLLWDNAFRRAEICGLDRFDFRPGESRLYLKGKGRIDKEPIDLAPRTVEAILEWLGSVDVIATNPALFLSSRDRRLAPEAIYDIVSSLAESAGFDRKVSPHMIRHSSITALLDANGGNVRAAQAHSRHKNLATLILYDDNRQGLQGESARLLADLV
jgi:integrase/recombinase XerC